MAPRCVAAGQLFKLRPHGSVPQGLLLMCMLLMLSLLTLNVFMTSLAPEYMTFGYQRYVRVCRPSHSRLPCALSGDREH